MDYDIAEKTLHLVQKNNTIDKPKTMNFEVKENLRKADINFMVNLIKNIDS